MKALRVLVIVRKTDVRSALFFISGFLLRARALLGKLDYTSIPIPGLGFEFGFYTRCLVRVSFFFSSDSRFPVVRVLATPLRASPREISP